MTISSLLRASLSSTIIALLFVGCCNKKESDSNAPAASASAEANDTSLDRPENWEKRVHNDKGFLFYVPKGTQEQEESEGTTFLYVAKMPPPHDKINLIIGAVKERSFGNSELKELSKVLLKAKDNATDLVFDSEQKLNPSFTIADGHYTKGGIKYKSCELLALDVNDRYLVLLTAPEADFARHEDDIDKVLANFEMFRSGKGSAGDEPPKSMPKKPAARGSGGGGASASICPECGRPEKEGNPTRCSDGQWRRCQGGKAVDPCPGGHYLATGVDDYCTYACAPGVKCQGECEADRKTCFVAR